MCGGWGGEVGGGGGGGLAFFHKILNQNTNLSVLFSSMYHKVYIWEADCGKMGEE